MPVLTDEVRYRVLEVIEKNPAITQREIARELGFSLGRANYCLQALIEKGILKAQSFRNSRNKRAYMYILTPSGIAEKAKVTARFLQRKLNEYETLQVEIAELMQRAQSVGGGDPREVAVLNEPGLPGPARRIR